MTPWTAACQAPLPMEFPKQEYWSGLPFPPPGDLPNPGTEPTSSGWQADSLPLNHFESLYYTTAGINPNVVLINWKTLNLSAIVLSC